MRIVRLLLCLFLLAITLSVEGCGLSPTSQNDGRTASSKLDAVVPEKQTVKPVGTASLVVNPSRLIIPTIGINALVEPLGILPNGDLATPVRNPWEDVGWYNGGPHPGEHGSAVIDGHLDRPRGYPAVFWRLRNLQVGSQVLVVNSDGKTLHFQVTSIAYYTPQSAPIQDIFGNSGGTYLNLITCAGDWIPTQHQTALRLVVYTSLQK
ncbi:MAG TPA: class F sortase [Ktedonobacteraceae bacterium]|nr:class F sortase [Ktedonobacteraceae bacterium]